jgi:hypothetical protein
VVVSEDWWEGLVVSEEDRFVLIMGRVTSLGCY